MKPPLIMPCRIELSEAERLTLEALSQHHPFADYRRRGLGLLALSKGYSPQIVADILNVAPASLYNWIKAWRRLGLIGLLNGHKGGRPAKLTATLLDTAEEIAREAPLTLREIAERVKAAHPLAPAFSLDRLAVGLKARGLLLPGRRRHGIRK